MTNKKLTSPTIKRISAVLKTYYKKRYKNPGVRLTKAKELKEYFKTSGEKVTVVNILRQTRQHRQAPSSPKGLAPEIIDELLLPTNYFNLPSYPSYIASDDTDVYFKSEISPLVLPMIKNGSSISYYQYFSNFVDLCNKQKADDDDTDVYQQEWYVRCTEPEFDKTENKWISRIISCDADGQETDYGFDPNQPIYNSPQRNSPTGQKNIKGGKNTQPPTQNAPTGQKTGQNSNIYTSNDPEIIKNQQEIEKMKLKLDQSREETRRQSILEVFKSFNAGKLTKQEVKEMLNLINNAK